MMRRGIINGRLALALALCAAAIAIGAAALHRLRNAGDSSEKFGWVPELAKAAAADVERALPKFRIAPPAFAEADNPSVRAVLWDVPKFLYGAHLPTLQQPIGCCVGASSAQAAQYLMAQAGEYVPLFPPYTYACGRNAPECGNGVFGRDPNGSVGAWQAKAAQLYGFLPCDAAGVPAWDKTSASAWAVKMPGPTYVTQGRLHVVHSIAPVKTLDDARRATQSYYPFTIASDWGGLMTPPVVKGMRLNRRATTWAHQMLVIGYQQVDGEPFWYVLNNWGPAAHGPPAADEPPGGFWIGSRDMQYILSKGDSWAYSDAVGFPARGLNFNVVRARIETRARLRLAVKRSGAGSPTKGLAL